MAKIKISEEAVTPSTPPTGFYKLYFLPDGCFYYLDDAGVETKLASGIDPDIRVSISANDTTPGFLLDKLVSASESNSSLAIELKEVNDGADEDLKVAFDQTKVDHDALLNFVAAEHIDWSQSGVGTIHASNYVDNDTIYSHPNHSGEVTSVTDGTQTVQATAISNKASKTTLAGTEEVLINDAGTLKKTTAQDVADLANGAVPSNCPSVQARRTTNYTITTAYTDITFDITDVENDPSVVEHDNVNTDRILIKETGLYLVNYHTQTNIGSDAMFDYRVRKNDTTVVPGSDTFRQDGGDTFPNGATFICECNAGDFLSFQVKRDMGSGTLEADTTFIVTKCSGEKGEKGDTGTGSTITLEEGGVSVTNTPHDTIDFNGADFNVADNADGSATVSLASSGGVTVSQASATSNTTTTSSSYTQVNAMTLTPGAGDYIVSFSSSWKNSGAQDLFCAIYVNGSIITHSERITRMESSIDNTELSVHTQAYVTGVGGGQVVEIKWKTTGGTATMLERSMILTKV